MVRTITINLVAACAMFTLAMGVFATQTASDAPVEAQTLTNARKLGATRLKVWGFQIYDARLWVEPDFSADDYTKSSFALELAYLRNFDKDAVAERSMQEMRRIGSMTLQQEALWLEEMRQLFPNIKKGDRITGVNLPGAGAAFSKNGKAIGQIRDPEFARLFFGIWLSPKTSEPQMRRALLGGDGATQR